MLNINGVSLKLIKWDFENGSKWGKMLFAVDGGAIEDMSSDMVSIYQSDFVSVLEVDCFILNNVSDATLFESSLESICESVLSVVNPSDIVLMDGGSYVSSDFVDDFEDEDEYLDGDVILDVEVADVEDGIDGFGEFEDGDSLDVFEDEFDFEDDDF